MFKCRFVSWSSWGLRRRFAGSSLSSSWCHLHDRKLLLRSCLFPIYKSTEFAALYRQVLPCDIIICVLQPFARKWYLLKSPVWMKHVWTQCRHHYSLWYVCGLLCVLAVHFRVFHFLSVYYSDRYIFPRVWFLPSVQFCGLRECVRHLPRFALLLFCFVFCLFVLFEVLSRKWC